VQINLLSAERLPVLEIARRIGTSRPMVWRMAAPGRGPDFAANLDDVVGPDMNPPRHLIENFFCKLKEFKRIAIRRDKTD
jgi:hypothetical protein